MRHSLQTLASGVLPLGLSLVPERQGPVFAAYGLMHAPGKMFLGDLRG